MKSSLRILIFVILVLNCANLQQILGQQGDNIQLQLAEIFTNEVQFKANNNNEYELSITEPESQRFEVISLDSSDKTSEPVVITRGRVETNFPKDNVNLVVDYVADRNGYRASYRIGKGLSEELDISFGPRLSIKDLMSLAG